MNKVTKGALATAAGVALLLGGGGTLALWSDAADTEGGTIVAGDLGLTAGAGVWTSNLSDAAIDIATYRIVPGETLTYTQDLTLKLVGNEMAANLTATAGNAAPETDPFTTKNIDVQTTYTTVAGVPAPTTFTQANNGHVVTASTSFTFRADTTVNLEDTGATYDFAEVAYVLAQDAPQ